MRLSRLIQKTFIPICLTQRRCRLCHPNSDWKVTNITADRETTRSLGCKIINERMDSIDINYIERALYFFWQCLYTRTHIHTHIHTYLLASFLISLFLSLSLSKLSRFSPPNNTFTRLSYSKVLLLLLWDIFTLSNVVSFFLSFSSQHSSAITVIQKNYTPLHFFIVPNGTESWHCRYLPQRSCCYYTLFLFMNLYEHAFFLYY